MVLRLFQVFVGFQQVLYSFVSVVTIFGTLPVVATFPSPDRVAPQLQLPLSWLSTGELQKSLHHHQNPYTAILERAVA